MYFLEKLSDFTRGFVEVGCDRHMSLACRRGRGQCCEQEAEGRRYHPDLHYYLRFAEPLTLVVRDPIYRNSRQQRATRREVLVKYSLGLAVALTLVASAAAAIENAPVRHHRHHHRHQTTQPATNSSAPAAQNGNLDTIRSPLKPYPHPGDGDNDGLSRDPDDCNKGCIDGNPG